MWSDVNTNYVKSLVLSNYKEYPYYVAQTVTYIDGSSSTYNSPTVKVYFSKEPITVNSAYSYTLPADSICYNIIGGNGNRNSKDARISVTNVNGRININKYEFVYTNAETQTQAYTIHPDIIATNELKQSHFDAGCILILIIMLATFVIKMMKG